MNKHFKMYGIPEQGDVEVLTRDMCWADSRLGRINLFDLAKKYYNKEKNLPNYVRQWSRQYKNEHYLITFARDCVNWSRKYRYIMIGYDVTADQIKEWYFDTDPVKTKYQERDLVIADKSFNAIVKDSLGQKTLKTIKINKGDIFTYSGQGKSRYKLVKPIDDDIKYDRVAEECYSYKHLLKYYTELDNGNYLYICLEDPNCFAKLPLDKLPKIDSEFYGVGPNYYGDKMEVKTVKIIGYKSYNKKLFLDTSWGTKDPKDKTNIWNRKEAEKLCDKKNVFKPIKMKKSDIKLYQKGFNLYQYGICAEYQTEEDRKAERDGSAMIDKALAPYEDYLFNRDQKNTMQSISVDDTEAYKKVGIILID